jgi:hypothetical protein
VFEDEDSNGVLVREGRKDNRFNFGAKINDLYPHITNKIIDVKDYLATRSFLLFVQPKDVLPKKERQKEHSTDRQTQPRRQTGNRNSLFFRLTFTGRRTCSH